MNRPHYKRLLNKEKKRTRVYFQMTIFAFFLLGVLILAITLYIESRKEFVSPVPADRVIKHGFSKVMRQIEIQAYEKPVAVYPECETETCEMIKYIADKFQGDADEMIAIIRTCENGKFTSDRVSPPNRNGTIDVGLAQINSIHGDTEELKDWRTNIDKAHELYQNRGNKFTDWTCAHVVGQKNYLGQ